MLRGRVKNNSRCNFSFLSDMFNKIHYFTESIAPSENFVLYQPGATFDKQYNSHFKPFNFIPPADVKKVILDGILQEFLLDAQ